MLAIEWRDMWLDPTPHQPSDHQPRSIGGVGCQPLWSETKAVLGPLQHRLGSGDLGAPARRRRFDVDDDRPLQIDPAKAGGASWYRDIGGGMGAALNAAQAMDASTISDRGTWMSFANKGDTIVLVEGDPRLLNRYDVILLNPERRHQGDREGLERYALAKLARRQERLATFERDSLGIYGAAHPVDARA